MQDGQLSEAVEQLAARSRGTPIKAKGELVQVVGEMLFAERPLECAHDPSLQQAGNPMATRQEIFSDVTERSDDLMAISSTFEARIATPAVGGYRRARLHHRAQRPRQRPGGSILDLRQPDPPDADRCGRAPHSSGRGCAG